jgi:DNA-binding transcriptional MerR regulator
VTFATPQTAFVVAKFSSELNVPIPRVRMYASKLLILPPQTKPKK